MEIRKATGAELAFAQVLALYASVGWTAYTDAPEALRQGLANSLTVLAAYDGEKLVGLTRAVGDGVSILYVQDLLVLPEYQRRGIGTALLKRLLAGYPQVRQKVLLTDNAPGSVAFYRRIGFVPAEDAGCMALLRLD